MGDRAHYVLISGLRPSALGANGLDLLSERCENMPDITQGGSIGNAWVVLFSRRIDLHCLTLCSVIRRAAMKNNLQQQQQQPRQHRTMDSYNNNAIENKTINNTVVGAREPTL